MPMNNKRNININVPVLTRVEGEGALELDIQDGDIKTLRLRIYEPPRYFEKFLENRSYLEVPDMVARICGICPVAYQMSGVQALEHALGFTPSDWVQNMRRLFYCGEWIQSHSLHIHLLAAPDFLGFDNALTMSADYPDIVQRGLKLQGLGNRIIELLGGRSVHPVGALPGGFHKAPAVTDVEQLLNSLQAASQDCHDLIEWTCGLALPATEQSLTCVALRHPDEYPMYQGRLVSSDGLDIGNDEYEQHFHEHHVAHSTALYSQYHDQPYLVGPLARINLNYEQVPEAIRRILENHGINIPSRNMFHSIIARAVELTIAVEQAIHILGQYRHTDRPYEKLTPRATTGYGCSEAPRGLLWHRYDMDDRGYIKRANIVPPTSQNQAQIEQDLRHSIMHHGLQRDDHDLKIFSESIIRNYDPCISCATHFLRLKINRR
jgi:coenzyme F420-reducing hydrogenase alpha subunit